jgi:hypothetical protein
MRSDWKKFLLIIAIITSILLNLVCEPSPKFLPEGNYKLIKLLDSKEDLVYPFFLDDNRIIFYSRSGNLNYTIWQTDTTGTNTATIFNDQSGWIDGFPKVNEFCSSVAYTMGEFVSVNLETLGTYDLTFQTPGGYQPKGVRLLQSDVYVYNVNTGVKKQMTHNSCSQFIRWLDDERILVMAMNKDTAVVMQTDRRVRHGEDSFSWSLGFELFFYPGELQVIDVGQDSASGFSPDGSLFLAKEIEKRDDVSLFSDSLVQIAKMHVKRRESIPQQLGIFFILGTTAQYSVIWADSSRIILTEWYKDTRDRFREKCNIIVVNLNTYDWTTIAKGVPKDLVQEIRITDDGILVINGDYRVGKISFDGQSQVFLETNESVWLRGMSVSPSGRMFVVSAVWVGSKGYALYLFKHKTGD